jgi:hypothetical protein
VIAGRVCTKTASQNGLYRGTEDVFIFSYSKTKLNIPWEVAFRTTLYVSVY